MTSPAPPIARLPRWTKCQSLGIPSSARYWHIAETTTRFVSTRSRSRRGVKSGGGGGSSRTGTPLCFSASAANQRSTSAVNAGSRCFRSSCVIRSERVSRLKANWIGSVSMYRSVPSNHWRLACAARWRLSTSGFRSDSYAASAAGHSPHGRARRPARPRPPSRAWSPIPPRSGRCARRPRSGLRCHGSSARRSGSGTSARSSGWRRAGALPAVRRRAPRSARSSPPPWRPPAALRQRLVGRLDDERRAVVAVAVRV